MYYQRCLARRTRSLRQSSTLFLATADVNRMLTHRLWCCPRRCGIVPGDAPPYSRPFWRTSPRITTETEVVAGKTCRRIRAAYDVHQRDRMRQTKRRDGKYSEARPCAEG